MVGGGEHQFEHGEDFRKQDMQAAPEAPKMDAKVISGDHSEISQPVQGHITDYIKKYDPQNSSGADPKQLDILDKLMKKGSQTLASLQGMIGAGNMSSAAASNNSDPNQSQSMCPPGSRWDAVAQKCVVDCPTGQHWDFATSKCVMDDPAEVAAAEAASSTIDPATGFPSLIL